MKTSDVIETFEAAFAADERARREAHESVLPLVRSLCDAGLVDEVDADPDFVCPECALGPDGCVCWSL